MKSHSVANTLHAYRNRFSSLLNASDGLLTGRAIWLFYAIVFGVMATAGVIAYLLHYPFRVHGAMTPGNEILMRASLCCAALIATGVMSGLDKESWLAYGLGAKYRAAHFGFGLLTGAFSLSLMMAALVLAGGASVTRSPNLTGSSIESGILWILVFLLIGWSEELIFRGYVFFKLVRKVGPVAAAVRTSLVFGFAHAFNGGESVLGLVQVVLFGLIACFAIWRTRSLWWIAGVHAAWDWSESFLFGSADSGRIVSGHWLTSQAIGPSWLSGGTTGPEGSLLAIPAMGILAIVVQLAFPKGGKDENLGDNTGASLADSAQ